MSDDLEQFDARNMASDPLYAAARQLLELGEAVTQLREGAKMTRGQLGRLLRVKAQDITIIEEETPRAPAGLLEAALRVLLEANGNVWSCPLKPATLQRRALASRIPFMSLAHSRMCRTSPQDGDLGPGGYAWF
ncbi:MAG: hypothetical protein NT167_24870 [Verrucomicrobia bacterium]|nr:hypothetical protein [Verrucomicrobiota bacterium]